ncbi:MAG TPA: TolC family protein [Gemmatimonadales bacterium]|nr:TolC family protein [Gemmatimonadales bacterium]
MMLLPLLAMLQMGSAAVPQAAPADSIPQVTLAEALAEATRYDPNYVQAAGFVGEATWVRRAAMLVFVLPSLTASADFTGSTTPSFNFGTNSLSSTIVTARVDARYELFTGGRKIADYQRATADLQGAVANEAGAGFLTAAQTEATFYDVLARKALVGVAQRRVERARSQLDISRARVLSGAAVQTDSLQVLLEYTRARVDLLREEAGLDVARAELGRRVGRSVAVDAAGSDTSAAPPLPISLEEAVQIALAQGPQIRVAEARARSTAAAVRARKAFYLPWVTLTGSIAAYDDKFYPTAADRTSGSLTVTLPIWNNGVREIALAQAKSANEVAIAIRDDLQRGALADVTRSYSAYETAAAAAALAAEAVVVAEENYRVQETRYRAGAVDIIEFLNGQVDLADAESGLVQARYATKLALAGLEVILGRRLFPSENAQ